MDKYEAAYIIGHRGLGDNITMLGSVNFLSQYYKKVYLACRDVNEQNIKLLLKENQFTFPYRLEHMRNTDTFMPLIKHLYDKDYTDIFFCGIPSIIKVNIPSKITHPAILNYKKTNKYSTQYAHISIFYNRMKLDLKIYYEFFNIDSSFRSNELYEKVKHLKIVFCHTEGSNRKINLSKDVKLLQNKPEYIVLCTDKNVYDKNHPYFELAEMFVNLLVQEYIDVIINADKFFMVNSCLSCILLPLYKTNRIKSNDTLKYKTTGTSNYKNDLIYLGFP